MLVSGQQLRAARAMAGLHREKLAELSGIAKQTIQRLEGMGRIRAHTTTVGSLQRALEAAGVELIGGDRPGVRMREALP